MTQLNAVEEFSEEFEFENESNVTTCPFCYISFESDESYLAHVDDCSTFNERDAD